MTDGTPPSDTLLVLLGPTAGGKESAAFHAAPHLNAEIVVVDSVKPYRGLGITSAAPPPEHADAVPHHLVGVLDPAERMHAARWAALAENAVADILARGKRSLIVGGTALYLRALLFGMFEGPARDDALRERLAAEEEADPGALHRRLTLVDPETAARVHANDRKRLLRAIEVHELTGTPISALQRQDTPKRPFHAIGLRRTKEDLHRRIALRVDRMVAAGLLDELRELLPAGRLGPTAREAIGVKELLPALQLERESGVLDRAALAEALEQVKRNTRRLARHQTTWWKRFPDVTWLDVAPDEPASAVGTRVADAFAQP
jgi:tRNA dimethylallyltransferase